MTYTPVTPFRRTVDAAIIKHQAKAQQQLPPTGVNKWEVLRELGVSREVFGLSDRDISVLQALVSFHPNTILGGNDADLVVHPSNVAICERLNGMANSTMRRHLSNLVQTGMIVRRDSPNGKRYARRYGDEKIAFGFDLTPLVIRHAEICQASEAVREARERYKRLRETVSLMRRDLAGLAAFGADTRPDLAIWDAFEDLATLTARDLRRKLDMDELGQIETRLSNALNAARNIIEPSKSKDVSTNESISEQHYQNSNSDSYDLEPSFEKARGEAVMPDPKPDTIDETDQIPESRLPNIPLGMVLAVCKEYLAYTDENIRHWHQLVRVADLLRPMMGISPSAWDEAKRAMGPEEAAVVVVAMLERFSDIKSPGGYLRSLSSKAALGEFSCGPMIMALMRREAA
jgi:replication initiation protein RepC